jgi:hypothetical protein
MGKSGDSNDSSARNFTSANIIDDMTAAMARAMDTSHIPVRFLTTVARPPVSFLLSVREAGSSRRA